MYTAVGMCMYSHIMCGASDHELMFHKFVIMCTCIPVAIELGDQHCEFIGDGHELHNRRTLPDILHFLESAFQRCTSPHLIYELKK